jgi:hypothetical protein
MSIAFEPLAAPTTPLNLQFGVTYAPVALVAALSAVLA